MFWTDGVTMNLVISTFSLLLASTERLICKRSCKHNKNMKIILTIYLCLSVACFRLVLTIFWNICYCRNPKPYRCWKLYITKTTKRTQKLKKRVLDAATSQIYTFKIKTKETLWTSELKYMLLCWQVTVTGSTVTVTSSLISHSKVPKYKQQNCRPYQYSS
jgi:hypothetical protein